MKKKIPIPSRDVLQDLLTYDQETGDLIVKSRGKVGSLNSEGYRVVWFLSRQWRAARVIWMFMTGEDPGEKEVDHRNGVENDDRWENLRLATRAQQRMNTRVPKNNKTTGIKGVSMRKDGKYVAVINANKKGHWLGSYSSLDDAAAARTEAEELLHKEFSHHAR